MFCKEKHPFDHGNVLTSRRVNRCWNSTDLRWSQSAVAMRVGTLQVMHRYFGPGDTSNPFSRSWHVSRQMRSPADIPLAWSVSVEIPNGVYHQTRSSAAMNSPGLAASRYIRACFECTRKPRTSQGLTIGTSQQLTIESCWTKGFMILHTAKHKPSHTSWTK